ELKTHHDLHGAGVSNRVDSSEAGGVYPAIRSGVKARQVGDGGVRPEATEVDRPVVIGELGVVEHVERVSAELQAGLFPDGKRLLYRHVDVVDAWLDEVPVRRFETDGAYLRRPESVRIDVEVGSTGDALCRVA